MPGKGFLILDHPADIGIEAYGENLAEAFEQAAVALTSIILDVSTVRESGKRNVRLNADDQGQLLVKWLTEILYLYDGKRFVGCRFEIERLTAESLQATIHGEMFDPKKHVTRLDVKAVTYHQLQVTESEKRTSVRVFLDV